MTNRYRTLAACLAALVTCAGGVRADQFGLLVPAANNAQAAGMDQAGQLGTGPSPVLDGSQPQAQYDWMGRLISFENGTAIGPETQAPALDTGCDTCCLPRWAHRCGVFLELLALRPRDAEVAYAVPIDGAIAPGVPPVQVGRIGVADPDYSGGWRLGSTWAFDECSSMALTYSRFESSTNDSIAATAPLVIRSLVLHPGTANAGADFLDARAVSDIDFDLLDLDYRAVWDSGELWAINYLVGFRYARLDQDFTGIFESTGTVDTLFTNSNFEGAGLRLGLDGERHACNCGLFLYGRSSVSFIAGDARATYTQSSDALGTLVNTSWEAGRIVTILDLELGAGWQSPCGCWRVNAGYLFASWYNVLPTDQWIRNVQTNDFVDDQHDNDAITFDGFTMRLTYQW